MNQPAKSLGAPERQWTGEVVGTGLLLLTVIIALVVLQHTSFLPGLSAAASRAAVLVCFTVCSWALGFFKEPMTTLLFFLLAMLFDVTPAQTIFGGFASPAWWLVFGGGITGIAVRTSGLAQRLSDLLLSMRMGTYGFYVSAVVLASVGLAFVMPSTTGRIMLLTPIALTLADRLGFGAGRRGRTGLVMAVAAASYMPPTSILPANIPNSVLLGAAEQLYGVKLHYAPYFLLHFPVLGALKSVILIWLVRSLYPDEIDPGLGRNHEATPLTAREIALGSVLALSLVCYATDFWHGISPAWVSLAAGIACLLPQTRIMSLKDFTEQMHIAPLVYVAGFLGLGAVVTESGLGVWAANLLLRAAPMEPGHYATNVLLILGIGASIGLVTTLPGLPAVLTPIAGQLARASGLPLYTVLMLQVPVFSTVFIPYQSPPMMIAMHMGGVSLKDGIRLCIPLAVLTVLFLLPLDYFWWRFLGVLSAAT
ncbi:SLC13 family permease [Burkholderia ubonensis]|uniref:SLC13 family permease n=1 Tax=Burkholderia ubonensis TaxID=101571 RepID=UPI00075D943C|nr:SLC13 family permease [Burkholderia ubonensis]KVA14116.1 sodium:sulfate symporter [Burkholderia ubonensis]KVA23232.1 sodium:sulfate symporter [Burkholderia ubonensis]KVA52843.1 sodium:sulfate symporter [Burkholderia ubonensis]